MSTTPFPHGRALLELAKPDELEGRELEPGGVDELEGGANEELGAAKDEEGAP